MKAIRLTYLFLVGLCLSSALPDIIAQTAIEASSISGKIVDQNGASLVGAYIVNVTNDMHTHADELGSFQLGSTRVGDTLHIHHLGFEKEILEVKEGERELFITLVPSFIMLNEVIVGQNELNSNLLSSIDVQINPVTSAQEVLTVVPGLFIGQHAGGGKAEQIFLRGFDIDHGTDVSLSVDGSPVNMVSHAHGQGYADLHFVIPETIERIDFGKGPYFADHGNFATAGYVQMQLKERLDKSMFQAEVGRFNTRRLLTMLDIHSNENQSLYVAGEYLFSDGPFETPQNFNRLNLMGKFTSSIGELDKVSISASFFDSEWDASGQIPVRAVASNRISRFGAIDDSEGGFTSRSNIVFKYLKGIDQNRYVKNKIFYAKYDFDLYSNFTFFLNDPINGDQIQQKESRSLIGLESEYNQIFKQSRSTAHLKLGAGLRYDNIHESRLDRVRKRRDLLSTVRLGDIDEHNYYGYATLDVEKGAWLFQPAVRLDYFRFNYVDKLQSGFLNEGRNKLAVTPKFNTIFNVNNRTQLYLKSGLGFHSNDTRVILNREVDDVLPLAYGSDLGIIFKPGPKLLVDVALWYLFLQQEFVYVGDEGIVEPSGRTRRQGIDLVVRYQPSPWLFLDANFNYAHARSVDEMEGDQYIPLAPLFSSSGGLTIQKPNWSGGLRYRYLADRPANEDYSITARGYWLTELNVNYHWNQVTFGLSIDNLFNVDWEEAQFATESRLSFESDAFEEIHFTPGAPLMVTGKIAFKF